MSEMSFRQGYPIDFNLYDIDQQNVLYIEDKPAGRQVKLEITNASTETIQLKGLTGSTVGPGTYHFALRFRPGTLAQASLAGAGKIILSTASAANWTMSGPVKDANAMDMLYFLAKTPLNLVPQGKIDIGLLNVGVDGAQGARGTRVELLYNNMAYQSTPTQILKSTRVDHLSIVNHRGATLIPLHTGFVGSNTILNDGKSPNTLKLRITNLLGPDAIYPGKDQLVFKYNVDDAKASKLILSFDTGSSSVEWALEAADKIKAISLQQPPGWKLAVPLEGKSLEWILRPASADQSLPGNGYLELTISNIITGYPTGQTNLYLRYENIPGYWDGQLVCVIEKQPLIYRGDNVGIGTTSPTQKLSVYNGEIVLQTGDNSRKQGILYQNVGGYYTWRIYRADAGNNMADLRFAGGIPLPDHNLLQDRLTINKDGNVGIGTTTPQARLEVNGDIITNVAKISDDPQGSDFAAFSHKNQGTPGGYALMQHKDGNSYINAPTGKNVSFRINNEDKMVLNSSGNVGIGNTSPNYPLSLGNNLSNTKIAIWDDNAQMAFGLGVDNNQFRFHLNHIGDRFSFLNAANATTDLVTIKGTGNVGIGTGDPKSKLDVNGDLKIKSQSPIVIKRFTNLGNSNSSKTDTGYKAIDYTAAVVGFRCLNGDIDEGHTKDVVIQVYMSIENGNWHINAYFATHNSTPNWTVDVMFVRNELCERIGYGDVVIPFPNWGRLVPHWGES